MLQIFKKGKRGIILLAALILALAVAVHGTVAYITFITPGVTNEFTPVFVTCAVEEDFADGVKSNVCIRNTGNTTAFIRVAMVANWVNDENGKVLAIAPKEGVDYIITWGDSGWQPSTDGFYYHSAAVAPDKTTLPLIKEARAVNAPEGYSLSLNILAHALQSDPERAVESTWGVNVDGNHITP